ncbi:MAG: acetylglutamate kinase [Bacteroidota bacterium]
MTQVLTLNTNYKQAREKFTGVSRWKGKTVVVKYGGAAMVNTELKTSFIGDIEFLRENGVKIIIVHGGGKEITEIADKLSLPVKFISGQRFTDQPMMEVVQMVLAGKTNKDIVAGFSKFSDTVVGVSGIDGGIFRVKKLNDGNEDLGLVGEITAVNNTILQFFLHNGFLTIIAPVGVDVDGTVYNINGDVAAAAIAEAVLADVLLFLSDVPGVLVNGEVYPALTHQTAGGLIQDGTIKGGMIPKIRSGFNALHGGVKTVHFIDGREKHAILRRLSSAKSMGTTLTFSPQNAAERISV